MPRVRMIVGRYGLFQPTHLSRLTTQNRKKSANSSRMNSSFGQPAGPRWNESDETPPYRSVTEKALETGRLCATVRRPSGPSLLTVPRSVVSVEAGWAPGEAAVEESRRPARRREHVLPSGSARALSAVKHQRGGGRYDGL
jgi:hypothetical protein